MMTHWKTTVAGVCTILGALSVFGMAVAHGQIDAPAIATLTAGLTAGIGLLHSADGSAIAPEALKDAK